MTTALAAVVTDVVRDGGCVVGYGFNANGCDGRRGLIRQRFAPRLRNTDAASLVDPVGETLDPHRCWAAIMSNEKPGGHGEGSVAVGTLEIGGKSSARSPTGSASTSACSPC
jgi:hypothetical protein